jgi:hypothetical protein
MPGRRGAALAVLLALAVGGCATLLPQTPSLPPSVMSPAYTQFRQDLDVEARSVARPPYRPVPGCTYRALATDLGGRGSDRPVELSVRPVRERLLVEIAAGSEISTGLIDRDGRMFDFSLVGQGVVVNPETWTSIAKERAESFRRAGRENAHVFNELSLIVPHYLPARLSPGATVAILADEDGGIWARHVYRGMTAFGGRQALLFDLLGSAAPSPVRADQLVGFALIDPATMLPLALILDTSQKLRFEQLACGQASKQ